MIKRIAYAAGVSLLLPTAIILLILVASGGLTWFQPQGDTQAAGQKQEKEQPASPLGVWSDIANFPTVTLGFSNDPQPTGPLRLKRAGAAAYHPNGKIYILGGRHRVDGDDIGSRWIWEYTPGNPGTIAQKAAMLDQNNFGSRFVANMAVVTLTDTNGVRIYAVGGNSVDSVAVNTVRVYDPNSDTLTTSDPWPASPARLPGGWAVHNNKLYIFGGYSAAGGDQLFADTWRFDPMAPSGSRWTQIASATLGTARTAIAGAALNGYIYAIGGNVVSGSPASTVTPVAVVERMNPSDANPTWQAVASLPYPRGDMGAWAYDTGSGYEIAGRILVSGGGYPLPDAHVYVYDPGANTWVYSNDMMRPRRNFAYTQLNGYLYAFGGYNVAVNGFWGLFDGDNDSMRYDATGAAPPPIITPSSTPSPTPTSPLANTPYSYTISTGATVVPGTTLVPGSTCVQCLNIITLPFPFTYYGTTFTQAMAGTSGNLQFMSNANWWVNNCLPDPAFSYAMMPFWDNLNQSGAGSGIYTSITGSAPNRIFNVEWRAGSGTNFEIRLYETTNQFEYIYGTLSGGSQVATIGSQRGGNNYTQVSCNAPTIVAGNKITWSQGPPSTPTPTVTGTPPTNTPTLTRTNTPIATPTTCVAGAYTIAMATATIVPGTTDIGNHCDDCVTDVTLPFPIILYGQIYTTVGLDSNGKAHFPTGGSVFTNSCLPQTGATYTIYPYWEDLRTDAAGSGIFTSVTGVEPNRIFNIEWRTTYFSGGGTANFELRLYEAPGGRFDIVYGTLALGNTSATGGVQLNGTNFTQDFCNGSGSQPTGSRVYTLQSGGCGTPSTTTPTTVATNTATRTPTTAPSSTRTPTRTSTTVPSATSTAPPPPSNTPVPPTATATSPAATATSPAATATNTQPVPSVTVPPATETGTAVPTDTPGPSPTSCTIEFTDVPVTNTFYPFVRCLACQGIVEGYPCGGDFEPCDPDNNPYFRPNNYVTRGQIAKIVSESAGFNEPVPSTQQSFEDVPSASPFWEYVERLYSRNVVGGYQCGIDPAEPCVPPENRPYFRPDHGATRGQLTKIVSEAAGLTDVIPAAQYSYADVMPNSTFWVYVERLMLNRPGVMSGYVCGSVPSEPCDAENRPYFRPDNTLTRGQTSKIVANTFFPGCNPPRP
jgi:N-acetylneuraminic acid mutarotase